MAGLMALLAGVASLFARRRKENKIEQ
nr:LPXTG cell wall anchor domain-containing protein [Siminovitchia terrae]